MGGAKYKNVGKRDKGGQRPAVLEREGGMEVVIELLLWYCWDAVRRVLPQRFPIANVSLLLVEKFLS